MGQDEIIKCLEKYDKPIARKQIADEIGWNVVKVSHLIKKLLKKGEIKCIELDRFQSGKLLKMGRPFRRMRFYYV